jgi:hypothetical protein
VAGGIHDGIREAARIVALGNGGLTFAIPFASRAAVRHDWGIDEPFE